MFWNPPPDLAVGVNPQGTLLCGLLCGRVAPQEKMFCVTNEALQLHETEPNRKRRKGKRNILKEFLTSYVGDVIDITNKIQTKAEFSNAMAVNG